MYRYLYHVFYVFNIPCILLFLYTFSLHTYSIKVMKTAAGVLYSFYLHHEGTKLYNQGPNFPSCDVTVKLETPICNVPACLLYPHHFLLIFFFFFFFLSHHFSLFTFFIFIVSSFHLFTRHMLTHLHRLLLAIIRKVMLHCCTSSLCFSYLR